MTPIQWKVDDTTTVMIDQTSTDDLIIIRQGIDIIHVHPDSSAVESLVRALICAQVVLGRGVLDLGAEGYTYGEDTP